MITFIFIAGVRSVILLCCKKETIMSETGDLERLYKCMLSSSGQLFVFPYFFGGFWVDFIYLIEYFDDFSFSDF